MQIFLGFYFSFFYPLVGGVRSQFGYSFPVWLGWSVGLFRGESGEVIHAFSFLNNNN